MLSVRRDSEPNIVLAAEDQVESPLSDDGHWPQAKVRVTCSILNGSEFSLKTQRFNLTQCVVDVVLLLSEVLEDSRLFISTILDYFHKLRDSAQHL